MVDNAPKLVLVNTERAGQAFPLTRNVTIIGRSPDSDILVESVSVSRSHARIERFGDHYVVSDLGSRNGIMLDGVAVPEGQLADGGMLTVGEVMFRAENIPEVRHEAVPPPPRRGGGRRDEEPTPAPMAPATGSGAARAEAPAPQTALQEPEPGVPLRPAASAQQQMLAEHAERFGPAFVIALAVVASAALLFLAWRAVGREGGAMVMNLQPVKVRVNERQWTPVEGEVRTGGVAHWASADILEGSIATDPEGVAKVERFGPRELVVTGLSYGDTVATMETPIGNLVRLRIMVRGRRETIEDAVRRFQGTDGERADLAERLIRAGDILMNRGRPYHALQEYERALHYARPAPAARHLHVEAREKISRAQRAVEERYRELADAARLARERHNMQRALEILNEIIALIPDENDPRNQRARDFFVVWELETEAARRRR